MGLQSEKTRDVINFGQFDHDNKDIKNIVHEFDGVPMLCARQQRMQIGLKSPFLKSYHFPL